MYSSLVPVEISIETMTGETFTERIRLYETVAELKNRIYRRKSIPPSRQALVLSGRALPNELELDRVGVHAGSVLKLFILTRTGPIDERAVRQNATSEAAIWSDETSDKERRTSYRRGLSAPEDTSAKDSSAGETEKEAEDGRMPNGGGGNGEEKQNGSRMQQKVQQSRRQRTLSLNQTNNHSKNGEQMIEKRSHATRYSAEEQYEPDQPCTSSAGIGNSANETLIVRSLSSPTEEDPSEDASELSSGMIVCDLSNEFRKLKVRRHRHQNQPSMSRIRPRSRPRGEKRAEVTSSDDNEHSARDEVAAHALLVDKLNLSRRGVNSSRAVRYSIGSTRSNASAGSIRCSVCAFKMNSVFNCRCGKILCSRHRNPQAHTCSKVRTKLQQVSD
ncbi:hypothetical protein WR25_08152 [Diploscapter pachys]|uniref:Ubiquitin-like domain-containing protein n=1 Tax=Diploscapter pachys TaxID=2018661 RepID=A0A2A2LSV5_9BILA|nr:hypothetical protein WR25_08152 [Diploscapter pachys]